MSKLIALQAGHENIAQNCDTHLRTGTGAPGEIEFTPRIRNRLKDILLSKKNADGTPAFQVKLYDANANCDPKISNDDFALFLTIHYEADVHGVGGGFVGKADPSVDAAHVETERIRAAMESEYFKNAGINNHPEWSNPNVTLYYMWQFLSPKTPCVLIECGVGQNAHDKVILADTDRVANAIARGICKAFNVQFDAPVPTPPAPPVPPTPPTIDWKAKYDNLKAKMQDILNNN